MLENFGLAAQLAVSQEGLSSMELVICMYVLYLMALLCYFLNRILVTDNV
jgi:hypothetical protein